MNDDGGPAYPVQTWFTDFERNVVPDACPEGASLRDYFAAHLQVDDRLVKCIRAMDDSALELYALQSRCRARSVVDGDRPDQLGGTTGRGLQGRKTARD